MYNRYTPQPDGTYSRSRLPDTIPEKAPPPPPRPEPAAQPPCPPPQQPRKHVPMPQQPSRPKPRKQGQDMDILTFARQLLPKNFDSGDLLVVLLLLLMSGDCSEDQNTALLTLALYLFL